MTCCQGLDVDRDHIIEMACIITDGNLHIIEEVCTEMFIFTK